MLGKVGELLSKLICLRLFVLVETGDVNEGEQTELTVFLVILNDEFSLHLVIDLRINNINENWWFRV